MSEINENENEERNIIQTRDEHGDIIEFELIDIINVDDQDYGLLIKIGNENEDDDSDEEDLIIMKMIEEEDGDVFEIIDEDEFNKVVAAIQADDDDL